MSVYDIFPYKNRYDRMTRAHRPNATCFRPSLASELLAKGLLNKEVLAKRRLARGSLARMSPLEDH